VWRVKEFVAVVTLETLLLATSLIAFGHEDALAWHGSCSFSGAERYGVLMDPSVSIQTAKGTRMDVVVKDGGSSVTLHEGGTHIETEYIWHDFDDMVELGYSIDRWQSGYYDAATMFDAMMLQGDYRGPRTHLDTFAHDSGHQFTIVWRENAQKYGFKLDGSFLQGIYRDSGWIDGHPNAGVEVSYQCQDEAQASFDNVQRMTSGGSWSDWSQTNYACDLLYHWGYDSTSSTSFDVSARGSESIPLSPVDSEDDSCREPTAYVMGWGD